MLTLLTTDIKDRVLRHVENGLKGKGTFPDAWFATQKDDGTRNQSSAKDSVEFVVVHVYPRCLLG
jgi:hypothetical protein